MITERIFQTLAVVLAAVAVYFFWTGNQDAFFICLVFGCVTFFLSIRVQVKRRNDIREAAIIAKLDAETAESEPPASAVGKMQDRNTN